MLEGQHPKTERLFIRVQPPIKDLVHQMGLAHGGYSNLIRDLVIQEARRTGLLPGRKQNGGSA